MALVDNGWYIDFGDGATTGYYAVTQWAAGTAKNAGNLIRQKTAPAVGSERVFVCTTGGTTAAVTEPTWTTTRGALQATDNGVIWQEATGIAALNGDFGTNTPTWNTVKNTAVTLGQVITNVAATIVLICTVAGTAGNGAEPAWNAYTTAGATTADNTVTWTNINVVGTYTGWQAPHARLANAFTATWGQAGNAFYVASEHAETQSTAMVLDSPGTLAKPCTVNCVTKTTVPPVSANVTTGATVSTTGASAITFDNGNGHTAYWNGLSFLSGSVANAASINFATSNGPTQFFKSCTFTLNNTSASSTFRFSQAGGGVGNYLFDTCTWVFGSNTGQSFAGSAGGNVFRILGGIVNVGVNIPTTLFVSYPSFLTLEGVDLSAFGSGKTLFGAASSAMTTVAKDCKLGASVTVAATPTASNQRTYIVRSDSSGTNYIEQVYEYQGTQTDETTIVRTGGATDGTTVKSRKIVTTANSKWILPFESDPIAIWNTSTSAITGLTIYGTTTGGGVPNNDDIWIDVEYLGASGSPLGSFKTSTKADNLAASATTNNSADGSTWGGAGAGNGFKIVCPSFTPGQVGYLYVYIKAAKATNTYYIDPLIAGVT